MNQRRTPFRGAVDQLTRTLVDSVLELVRSTLLPELAASLRQQTISDAAPRRAARPAASARKGARAGAAAEPRRKRDEPAWAESIDDEAEWAGTTVITDPMAVLKAGMAEVVASAGDLAEPEAPEGADAPSASADEPAPRIANAAPPTPPAPAVAVVRVATVVPRTRRARPAPPPPPAPRVEAAPAVRVGEDILRTGTGVVVLRRGKRQAGHHAQ